MGPLRRRPPPVAGRRGAVARTAARDGETAFVRGWSALGGGDFAAAAEDFGDAASSGDGGLIEDALFWRGVALDRAGRLSAARDALARFLDRYPDSGRKGEASVMLGWLLVRSGELDEARARFEDARGDPDARVRSSAQAGLGEVSAAAR